MTQDDFPMFAKLLGVVAVAANRDLDDPTIDVFFKGLEDVPIELLRFACPIVVREHTDRWPSIPTWRKVVDEVQERHKSDLQRIQREAAQKLLQPVLDGGDYVPTFACGDCRDTGWRPDCGCSVANLFVATDRDCGDRVGECRFHGGREANGRTYGRAFMPCSCRATNPAFQAEHAKTFTRYSKPKKGD